MSPKETRRSPVQLVGLDAIDSARSTVAQVNQATELLSERDALTSRLALRTTNQEAIKARVEAIQPFVNSYKPETGDLSPLTRPEIGIISESGVRNLQEQKDQLRQLHSLPQIPSVLSHIKTLEDAIAQNETTIGTAVEDQRATALSRKAQVAEHVQSHYGSRIDSINARIAEIDKQPGVQELLDQREREKKEATEHSERQARQERFSVIRTQVDAIDAKLQASWRNIFAISQPAMDEHLGDRAPQNAAELRRKIDEIYKRGVKPNSPQEQLVTSVQESLRLAVEREIQESTQGNGHRIQVPAVLYRVSPWMDQSRPQRNAAGTFTYDTLQATLTRQETREEIASLRSTIGNGLEEAAVRSLGADLDRVLAERTILRIQILGSAWRQYHEMRNQPVTTQVAVPISR